MQSSGAEHDMVMKQKGEEGEVEDSQHHSSRLMKTLFID